MCDWPNETPHEVRSKIRHGAWTSVTTDLRLGYVQANLVILPGELSADFRQFCERNPGPLPLLDVTGPGDPRPRRVAPDADIRMDVSVK